MYFKGIIIFLISLKFQESLWNQQLQSHYGGSLLNPVAVDSKTFLMIDLRLLILKKLNAIIISLLDILILNMRFSGTVTYNFFCRYLFISLGALNNHKAPDLTNFFASGRYIIHAIITEISNNVKFCVIS